MKIKIHQLKDNLFMAEIQLDIGIRSSIGIFINKEDKQKLEYQLKSIKDGKTVREGYLVGSLLSN